MMQTILEKMILCAALIYFGQANIFGKIEATHEVEVTTKIRCSSDVAEISYIVQSSGPDRLTTASINDRIVSPSDLAAINRRIVTDKIDKISLQGCPGDDHGGNVIKLYLELYEPAGKRLFILLLNRDGALIVE